MHSSKAVCTLVVALALLRAAGLTPTANAPGPELICRCHEIHLSGDSCLGCWHGQMDSLFWILNCIVKKMIPDGSQFCWDLETATSPSHRGGAWGLRGRERWLGFVPRWKLACLCLLSVAGVSHEGKTLGASWLTELLAFLFVCFLIQMQSHPHFVKVRFCLFC